MESSKKTLLTVIGIAILVISVVGVAFAFFNYTRTGANNSIRVGRIYFNSEEGQAINLTNLFPIDVSEGIPNDATKVGTLTINIKGDTEYNGGIEYLVSAVNVTNTSGSGNDAKRLPISISVSVENNSGNNPVTTLGSADADYFSDRGPSAQTSIYKVLATGAIESDSDILVGYIKEGSTGVDGNIVIKAYIDKARVAITDTYPEETIREVKTTGYSSSNCETVLTGVSNASTYCASAASLQSAIDNENLTSAQVTLLINAGIVREYTNGTSSEWVGDREVFTTAEWNALQQSGISFKIKVVANEGVWVEERITSYEKISRNLSTSAEIDFAYVTSADNGRGMYILPGTSGNTYPIYYYRGAVENNNVIFGGYCWQIIRTTDTGGIKMIYNGVATDNGTTCNNTTHATRVLPDSSKFNSSYFEPSTLGYMHNKTYARGGSPSENVYFGTSVEYGDFDNNGTNEYRLYDDGNNSISLTKDENHHYSCNSTSTTGTCSTIRYYQYDNYSTEISSGENVEDALYKMTGNGSSTVKSRAINQGYNLNENDSVIKTAIENWFKTNLTNEVDNTKINYQQYLEDTTYCNDRSFKTVESNTSNPIYTKSGWYANGGSVSGSLYFGVWDRYKNNWYSDSNVPNLSCSNVTDQFRMNNPAAPLNYPVGLITVDEVILAGEGGTSSSTYSGYLITGDVYWTMSASYMNYDTTRMAAVGENGNITSVAPTISKGVRPVVSLKLGTEFESGGEGTASKPYVVKYN